LGDDGHGTEAAISAAVRCRYNGPILDAGACVEPFYRDDRVSIYHGDSTHLPFVGDESVDLTITSPPYNAERGRERPDQAGGGVSPEEAVALHQQHLRAGLGRADGGADAGRPAADHQHVRLARDRHAGLVVDLLHRPTP
jgi:hypothetical protein